MKQEYFFRNRLQGLIDGSSLHTATSLSVAIGKSRGYISGVLNGKSDPSYSTMLAIADQLGTSIRELTSPDPELSLYQEKGPGGEMDRQAGMLMNRLISAVSRRMEIGSQEFTIDDLLIWWRQNNGRLSGVDRFIENVDIIHMPESPDVIMEPHRLGANSLATQSLTTQDPQRMKMFLEHMDINERRDLTISYMETKRKPLTDVPSVVVDLPDMAHPLHLTYCRVLLPVTDARGTPYILNYSRLID